jgi:ribosome-binding factor A
MPPRDPRRVDRVGEAVRETVAAFLARDAKDPRITGFVTVTAVEMTRDLRNATVYVSVMGTESEKLATICAVTSAARCGCSSRPRSRSSSTSRSRVPRASRRCSTA